MNRTRIQLQLTVLHTTDSRRTFMCVCVCVCVGTTTWRINQNGSLWWRRRRCGLSSFVSLKKRNRRTDGPGTRRFKYRKIKKELNTIIKSYFSFIQFLCVPANADLNGSFRSAFGLFTSGRRSIGTRDSCENANETPPPRRQCAEESGYASIRRVYL
jgi:hypothetical protein